MHNQSRKRNIIAFLSFMDVSLKFSDMCDTFEIFSEVRESVTDWEGVF